MADITKIDKTTPEYREWAFQQLITGGGYWKTICEVFRMLYDEMEPLPQSDSKERMIELLIDGIIMAKNMDFRLTYYHQKYKDGSGKQGKNLLRLYDVKRRRLLRQKRMANYVKRYNDTVLHK